jgi:hypothetical protein
MTNKCEKTVAFFKSLPQDDVTVWKKGERPIAVGCQSEVFAYAPSENLPLLVALVTKNSIGVSVYDTYKCSLETIEIINLKELGFVEPVKYEDVQVHRAALEDTDGTWYLTSSLFTTKSKSIKEGLRCANSDPTWSGRVGIFDVTTNTITDIQRSKWG